MFKLKGPGDERGISEVLGAILVLGMVIGVGSLIYSQYVQSSIHSSEADHMNAVGEAFIKLKSSISAMEIGQSSIANIPMNTSFPLLVSASGEVGTLSLLPGIAYYKGATSYTIVNNKGSVSGSLNALKANDDDYLKVSQVIFNEKFPNTSGWIMYEVPPDNGGDAFFDSYGYTSGDGTGSISVITSGETAGYYDKKGHYHKGKPINTPENAYWEHAFGGSLDNYPNVTLQAWFGKEIDYSVFPDTENAAWWIEVETNGPPENQTLYAHQENDKNLSDKNISFVAAGTGSGVAENPTPGYPAGLQANDLILMQVTVRDTATTPITPAGFALLYGPNSTGTGRQWIYYKFSDGTENGTIAVTIGGDKCKIARMYAFRDVALSSFTEGENFGSGTGATISAPSVTTTGVNRLAVSFVFVNDNDSVGSFTGETGGNWTEADEFNTDAGSDGDVQLQTATMASAGTISGGSYSMTAADPWGVRAFALIPSNDYHLLKENSANNTGTNLSVSTASAGRQLWGRFVYPLAGISAIPSSTWTDYYRSWLSTYYDNVSGENVYQGGSRNFENAKAADNKYENIFENDYQIITYDNTYALAVYYDNTSTPKYRIWNGTAWSAQDNCTALSGTLEWVVLKYSRKRNEAILGTLDNKGDIRVQFWNGSAWSATKLIANVGTTNDNFRCFDIEYENGTDRAVIVFAENTAAKKLKYSVWDGSTWKPDNENIDLNYPTTGVIYWVEMAANPTADNNEIALIYGDNKSGVFGYRWSGTAWDNMGATAVWDNTGSTNPKAKWVDVAYEQQSGSIMFMWADAVATAQYWRIYENTPRVLSAATLLTISTAGSIGNWIKLVSDPRTDNILYAMQTVEFKLEVCEWSGSAWGASSELDAGMEDTLDPNFGMTYEMFPDNVGHAWIMYGDSATVSRQHKTGSTWETATVVAGSDNTARVFMITHPVSGVVFSIMAQDSTSAADDLLENHYDGTWGGTSFWAGPMGANPVFEGFGIAPKIVTVTNCYIENVQHNITGIPMTTNNWLQIGYYTAGNEAFSVYMENFASGGWDNVGVLQGGSSGSQNTFTYTIDNNHIYGGNVHVRHVQPDPDNVLSSLMVDYTRVATAAVAHSDISILIRESNGVIRDNITGYLGVANSDNITSTENTYSGTYPFGGYTVWNDNDYLEIDYYCDVTYAAPGTAYLKIDNNILASADQTRVKNVLFAYPIWNTVLLYNVSTNVNDQNGIVYWNKKDTLPNGIENGILKIRAHMYDNLKPKKDKIDTYLSIWTDEITLFAGPPFDVDTILTSMPIIAPENLDNIVGNLAFLSNSSASYTLQIQKSNGDWETFADRSNIDVGLDKVYWVETIGGAENMTRDNDPRNYIYNNVINIRITGHNDSSPFSLCLDYLDFQVNYEEGSENYLASIYGGNGKLTFTMINYSYPNQTYVYDDGAVIVAQLNSSAIASGGAPTPDLVNVTDMGGGKIRVDINHFVLTGSGASSISRRGWSAIRATVVNSYYLSQGANVSDVSIEIYTSPYTDQAWVNYLSGLGNDFEARGYHPLPLIRDPLTATGGERLTLTIQGKNTDDAPDISYYEKVTEVQVQLA